MQICYQEFGYAVIQFSRRVLLSMWGGGVLMILDVGVLCWQCATGWGGWALKILGVGVLYWR